MSHYVDPGYNTRHFQHVRNPLPPTTIPAISKERLLLYGGLLLVLTGLGMLFQDVTYGRILLLAYGAVALIRHVPSEDTIKMALISLGGVCLLAMLQNFELMRNFAEYAFLLLIIGFISAAIEQVSVRNRYEL